MTTEVGRLRRQATLDQALEQVLGHARVLARAWRQPQQMFLALAIHAHGRQNVMPVHHDAIEVDGEQIEVFQAPLHQFLQGFLRGLDEPARHTALLDPDRAGHLGQDLGVVAGGDAGDQDVTNAAPQPWLLAQALVGRDRYLALGAAQPWAFHGELAFGERDATRLCPVPAHRARVFARMFRTGYLGGREHEQLLDEGSGGICHQFIDAGLGIFDQLQHWQERLPVVGEAGGQGPPVMLGDNPGIGLVRGLLCFTMFHGGFLVSLRF